MSNLEGKLREALRAVEPQDGFADRVLAKLASEASPSGHEAQPGSRFRPRHARWMSIALAASVLAAVLIGQQWRVQTEHEGLEAKRQLLEALRMTSDKLDLAYQVVNNASHPEARDEPGA